MTVFLLDTHFKVLDTQQRMSFFGIRMLSVKKFKGEVNVVKQKIQKKEILR